jgi:alpha-L-fucosidase
MRKSKTIFKAGLLKTSGIIFLGIFLSCTQITPPAAVGPIPSERQLAWHDMEYYAFIHFNMNTFTDMEWGLGGESPALFNPTELDARQWARVAKEAGMKGIIITAKHHDGFCLWPSKYTEHSVKNSPWKDGKGDVLKDLAAACKEYGLKMGVYLSPWDRNHADYGKPEYVDYFHNQLRELLTDYGPIFEVWFDGANGGSGYYGGANETRKIDNKTYYQWDKAIEIVRELQPNAVIFGDGGPDVRWVGNEEGWANETNWSLLRRDEVYPGWPKYVELRSGHEDGTHWVPAEVNVSIRPGWYYHPSEDHQVKSLSSLLAIYYHSLGRNGNFLLNLPVDTRGLVHETDIQQIMALKGQLEKDFATNVALNQAISTSNTRGKSKTFAAEQLIDGDKTTYWATDDGIKEAAITLAFETPTEVNRLLLQEYIPLGQRVQSFTVEAEVEGNWIEIDKQTTIGYKRILRFSTVKASKIRVTITAAKAAPALSNMELYRAPNLLTSPEIKRSIDGVVTLSASDEKVTVYYTLDGSDPTSASQKYTAPFTIEKPAILKVMAVDSEDNRQTEIITKPLDIPKRDWKVISVTSGKKEETRKLMDEEPTTFWATDEGVTTPQEIVIDLGQAYSLKGFTYWPIQERYPFGIIPNYEFAVSTDNRNWRTVAQGEFGNISNSPVEQTIMFTPVQGRYIKLKGVKVKGSDFRTSFGEIGVVTVP